MSQLVIEIDNPADEELLLQLLPKLNGRLIEKSADIDKNSLKSPVYWLEQIAQRGGVSSIEDPSEWQREIRKDRELPGRE